MQTANAETASEPGFSPEQTAQALLNLRCAVDHCHDVVLITDADGRIEFVNPSFRDVTGFAASEVLGQNLASLKNPSSNGNSTSLSEQASDPGVHLPVAPPGPTAPRLVPSVPEVVPGSETVLVVEDDQAVLAATVEFLSSIGYQVLGASNGVEALRIIESHTGAISLMLTDVVMPMMNGTKLANLVTSRRPEMKVLFVSGHGENELAGKGLTEFDKRFLEKPCTFELLSAKIREALEEPAPPVRAAVAGAS